MRKDTSFGEGKLTREEFAAKYWKGGDPNYIYQYHTMDIEDGRDEREQLLINNIRALWNMLRAFKRMQIEVTAQEGQLQDGLDPEKVVEELNQLSGSSRKSFR